MNEKTAIKEICLVQRYVGATGGNKNYSGTLKRCELIFKLNGDNIVHFDGNTAREKAYSVRILPICNKHTAYTVECLEGGECIDIYFIPENIEDFKFSVENFENNEMLKSLFQKVLACWQTKPDGWYHKCMALFYDILSEIYKSKKGNYRSARDLEKLTPAVEYLSKNIFSASLDVSGLHRLCGLGNTRFKELFISRFNMPPLRYIINKRIATACEMLEFGHSDVKEIAYAVGYEDPCYFSRLFKKEMGTTALEYRSNATRKKA